MWNPDHDGITHINVYSKGRTALGRLLSNFADTPFRIPLMGTFGSVEAFWYWTITGDDTVRHLHGYKAKQIGSKLPRKRPPPTKRELKIAYRAKLNKHWYLKSCLQSNKLPLAHYYVYGGKVVEPKQWQWTASLWTELF